MTAVLATTVGTVLMALPAAAAPAYAVTANIGTGDWPHAVGVNETTDTIYVANSTGNSVSVIDGATNTVAATVPVGGSPFAVGVDEATNTTYVPNASSDTVSVIDGATNTVTATVAGGLEPWAVAVNATTNDIYVANVAGDTVSVIQGATNAVTATVPVGASPYAVGVDEATDTIYVANATSGTVSVIDGATNTVTATVAVGGEPYALAVDETTDTIYLPNYADGTLSVLDGATNTVTATLPVGSQPNAVAVDETTDTIYVPSEGNDTLSVIDGATNTVTATMAVGTEPYAVAADPARHVAYVTNLGNTLSVIDGTTNTVTATLGVGSVPLAVAVDQTTGTAYVTNASANTVSVIDSTEAPTATTLTAGPSPVAGVPIALTATIVPAPTGGTAAFTEGGSPIPGCTAQPVDSTTGVATCTVTFASPGPQTVAVSYTGAAGYAASAAAPLTFTVVAAPVSRTTPVISRVAGPDRYATAVAASKAQFPTGGAGAVVLATGNDYPDALVGTPLATAKDAPLLLTTGTTLPAVTRAEIVRVLPPGRTVYVLGSTAAVPASVASQLAGLGYPVDRIAGPDRYTTAVKVADSLGDPATVLLASGLSYPDDLAAGPAAAHTHGVVLLTAGTSLGALTTSYLAAHPGTTYAVGGPAVAADPAATALAGTNRYATAATVAARFFPTPARVGIATGANFPDALSGGALVAANDGPMLLADPGHTSEAIGYLALQPATVDQCWLLGDTDAMPATVTDTITTALAR